MKSAGCCRKAGFSQRQIALRIGVSRGTVNAIALGRRRDYSAHDRQRDDGFIPPTGKPMRCPGCGGLAQMPCLLCYLRAKRQTRAGGETKFLLTTQSRNQWNSELRLIVPTARPWRVITTPRIETRQRNS